MATQIDQGAGSESLGYDLADESERSFGIPMFEQIWNAVLNHKLVILAIIAGCIILGLLVTLLTTPQYTASSRIEISRKQDNVTNVEGLQSDDFARDLEFYETQYALLGARSLADRVVRAENLVGNDKFFEYYGVDLTQLSVVDEKRRTNLDSESRARRSKLASILLLRNISISPVRGSSLVDVRFTSPDRVFSAKIVNSWAEQFIESNLDRRFAATQDARDFLEGRLGELRERLEQSERQLVGYASAKEIVTLSSSQNADGNTKSDRTLAGNDLEAMNIALARATADRIAAESAARQGSSISRANLTNRTIAGLRQRRAEIEAERAKLLVQFEPEYPTVKALTSEIQALDKSIGREENRVNSGARSAYSEALQRERDLQRRVKELKSRFTGQQRDSIQYNIYQREVDTNRQLYNGLLQRFKEIGVAGVGTNNIAIVDKALVPSNPSSPNLLLNLAFAFLAGVGLAGAYVFVQEQVDQSLRNPASVKDILGLTPLGAVPDIESDDIFEALEDTKSPISEAYFSIGTSLSFLTDHGAPRSMLFTSTRPNEGKTTSAYALAEMLSRTGRNTLLIDGDMRNPSVHHIVETENSRGLSNLLSGDDELQGVIHATSRKNFSVMAAGPIPPNPAELLSGNRFKKIIEKLNETYDHVIVDAPPVLGLADVPLLAKSVEGIICVILANGAKLRAIRSGIQRIRAANTPIFGAIVTRIDNRNSSYGYGYGYGYGYEYSGEASSEKAS